MRQIEFNELAEFFNGDVPRWVILESTTPETFVICANGIDNTIRPDHVLDYFLSSRGPSGLRSFAGIDGDWRQIDELAHLACAFFEKFNPESLNGLQ